MIYNVWDGHNKMQVNSRCIHYKNSSTGWRQYESLSIQNSCYSEMFYILYNGISFETEVHGRT